jgi:hypothetical protein
VDISKLLKLFPANFASPEEVMIMRMRWIIKRSARKNLREYNQHP